ncbi:MAG: PQQ-binding-like beta-propeller repeat protein [Chitinophagaceae bacterium]|nr:PQQ-binding-like beta-propeller repeat protein [Chitinophagaceae bacterium]
MLPGGAIFGSLALDSATIYFGSDDKKVYALNKFTGASKWSV